MDNRVNPSAKDLRAQTISDDWNNQFRGNENASFGDKLNFNKNWLNDKMNNNYHIYDLGRGTISNPSPFYRMELNLININNYPKTNINYYDYFNNKVRIQIF